MNRVSMRILTMSCAALSCGALAMAQARPMGGASPQQTAPTTQTNSNPGTNYPDQTQNQAPEQSVMQDKDFVHTEMESGMAEVQMGQLASQKGSSADVKEYGQKMVDANTQLGNQMKQLAQQMGVKEPKDLSKKDKQEVAKLNALSGADFDNAYIAVMVKDHKKDVDNFKSEAQNSQNSTMQKVAQQDGQIIDQHLQVAEQLAKAHNTVASK